jgi:hypothetical protein
MNMMQSGGWMMVGAGLFWLLIIITLILSIAALLKYLRSGPK